MKRILVSTLVLFSVFSLMAQEAKYAFWEEKKEKVKPEYHLTVTWRVLAGYVQDWQNSPEMSYPDLYLHGGKAGFAVDFNLPYNLSVQTGAAYALTYGTTTQHWASASAEQTQVETLVHRVMKHNINIPVFLCYRQALWKDLAMVFYGGPQLQIGVYQKDNIKANVSQATLQWLNASGIMTEPYNRYAQEQLPVNLQMCVGGGFEWGPYRLQGGYDFGIVNMARQYPVGSSLQKSYGAYMREWSWNVCFVYKF